MTQISTQQQQPSRETLDFLRYFARTYRALHAKECHIVVGSGAQGYTLPN